MEDSHEHLEFALLQTGSLCRRHIHSKGVSPLQKGLKRYLIAFQI